MYWNFVAIDGVIKNQLGKFSSSPNVVKKRECQTWKMNLILLALQSVIYYIWIIEQGAEEDI
jgi:hypothetical protein